MARSKSLKKRVDNIETSVMYRWISLVLWLIVTMINDFNLKFWEYPLISMILAIVSIGLQIYGLFIFYNR